MNGDCGPRGGRQQPPAPQCPTQHPGQEQPCTPARCCPGSRIPPGHSGLLLDPRDALCPRPGGISPCSCSLCPGHCCQTAWPLSEARGPGHVAWGGCHALPTGSRVALQDAVSPQRVREWAQARWDGLSLPPWPLPPCSGFAQSKRTPGLGAPPPLPQSLWLYLPSLTQTYKLSLPMGSGVASAWVPLLEPRWAA